MEELKHIWTQVPTNSSEDGPDGYFVQRKDKCSRCGCLRITSGFKGVEDSFGETFHRDTTYNSPNDPGCIAWDSLKEDRIDP